MLRTLTRWLIAVVVCMVLGALPAFALTLQLPFKTISEARDAASSVTIGMCGPEKFVGDLWIPGKSEHQAFRLLSSGTRFLVMEASDDDVVQVYFGKVVNAEELVVTEILDLQGAQTKYQTPCSYLYPEGA